MIRHGKDVLKLMISAAKLMELDASIAQAGQDAFCLV